LGWGHPKLDLDPSHHRLDRLQHLIVPESDHLETHALDIGRSFAIAAFIFVMLAAIELDHKPGRAADEVADEGAYRDLAAEFCPGDLTTAEVSPKFALGGRGGLAELLGA
jgi:hypothetical protein